MVISLDIDTLTNIWTFTQILEWRHTTQTDCRSEEWGDDVKSPCKVRTCHHLIKRLLEMEEKVSFYMMLHNPLWMQMQVGWLMMDCTDTGQRISVVMPSSMWDRESLLCCPLVCGTENLCYVVPWYVGQRISVELSHDMWDRESVLSCPLVCGTENLCGAVPWYVGWKEGRQKLKQIIPLTVLTPASPLHCLLGWSCCTLQTAAWEGQTCQPECGAQRRL